MDSQKPLARSDDGDNLTPQEIVRVTASKRRVTGVELVTRDDEGLRGEPSGTRSTLSSIIGYVREVRSPLNRLPTGSSWLSIPVP